MALERALPVAVALILAVGIGMAATTMRSSVDTTPNDVIDIDSSGAPIAADKFQEYKERYVSGGEGDSSRTTVVTTKAPRRGEGGETGEVHRATTVGEAPSIADEGDPTAAPTETSGPGEGPGPGPGSGPGEPQQSLFDQLASLLQSLLALLPLLVLLGLLVAAVHYRDRLLALAERLGLLGGADADDRPEAPAPRAVPTNDIEQIWHEMVTHLGIERPETMTPRECVDAAAAGGAEREPVEQITRVFEQVRYAHAPVTDERRRRARDAFERIRSGGDLAQSEGSR